MELIESDCHKYSKLGQIILAGDLNARIATELDFVLNDSSQHIPVHYDYVEDTDIGLRSSQDSIKTSLNHRGKQLLDLCVSAGIRVANGRLFVRS